MRRPFLPAGRYIFPTLRSKEDEVMDKLDAVLKGLADRAGF